jgi:hypothetical protein
MERLVESWRLLRVQWWESSRARYGVWLALLFLGLVGVQSLQGWRVAKMGEAEVLAADLARWQAAPELAVWKARVEVGAGRATVVRSMVWRDAEIGLVESALQDWVRGTAGKLGLPVRQIRVTRLEPSRAAPERTAEQGAASELPGQPLPPGQVALRARVVFELKRGPLMNFLTECARYERAVVVERFSLRLLSQPMTAELDLRVVAAQAASVN